MDSDDEERQDHTHRLARSVAAIEALVSSALAATDRSVPQNAPVAELLKLAQHRVFELAAQLRSIEASDHVIDLDAHQHQQAEGTTLADGP